MGKHINPGSKAFSLINKSSYIDKTLLIDLVNQAIESGHPLNYISCPRGFGKSWAVKMLTAYYDSGCDSHPLFDDKKIASTESYEKHINKYNIVYLEITSFTHKARNNGYAFHDIPKLIEKVLSDEIDSIFGTQLKNKDLMDKMLSIVENGNSKFFFVIDEWDAVIREGKDDKEAQKAYLEMLRAWFKNGTFTPKVVAGAYMTGILPIKNDGSQSALSDFYEYTMIKPADYAQFVGFTEKEVEEICRAKSTDFKAMKQWYNGYTFPSVGAVYNPSSVMKAIDYKSFDSYWVLTSAAEALLEYIGKSYNGLSKTIAELVGGIDVKVDTVGFANDLTTFRSKDDVLTLLIHLGYLAYNEENGTVRIPNEEIKKEFQRAIHTTSLEESRKRLDESEYLFDNTINMNEEEVALQIEKVHREETAPLFYNREESLRSVIKLAYYTYRDHYLQFEELPCGNGYADIVYIPLPDSGFPALVIELKNNESAEGAINQIKEKKYPTCLKNYKGNILLVGINYDGKSKKHTAAISAYSF